MSLVGIDSVLVNAYSLYLELGHLPFAINSLISPEQFSACESSILSGMSFPVCSGTGLVPGNAGALARCSFSCGRSFGVEIDLLRENLSLIDDLLKLSIEERNLGGVRLLFLRVSFFPPAYGEGWRLCSVTLGGVRLLLKLKFFSS
uniref:Uncharacterized protein n=1 Tax=Arundo donax TaxID=35708 RepID=A0A0A9DM25_ARUDO